MSLQDLDKEKLKLILRTSECFTSQRSRRPSHSLGIHLRGTRPRKDQIGKRDVWTCFCSFDDMADALDCALRTIPGSSALRDLQRGSIRQNIHVCLPRLFGIEGAIGPDQEQKSKIPPQYFKFSKAELGKAGLTYSRCFAALEGRTRGSEKYLHVQTFYPYFDDNELARLLAPETSP